MGASHSPRRWVRLAALIFLFFLSIKIIDLGKNSRQIFGFKGLICIILRNNDLEVPGFRVSEFQGFKVFSLAKREKGAVVIRTLLTFISDLLFVLYSSILSVSTTQLDMSSNFIFLAEPLT